MKGKDKQDIRSATEQVFTLMLAIPVKVLHDHYGALMKKQVDNLSREERFANLCIDLYKRFESGELTLDDLKSDLRDIGGVEVG